MGCMIPQCLKIMERNMTRIPKCPTCTVFLEDMVTKDADGPAIKDTERSSTVFIEDMVTKQADGPAIKDTKDPQNLAAVQ